MPRFVSAKGGKFPSLKRILNMEAVAIQKNKKMMYHMVAVCKLVDQTEGVLLRVALRTGWGEGKNVVRLSVDGNEHWSGREESMRAMVPVEVLRADGEYPSEKLAKAAWDAAIARLFILKIVNL